MSLDASYRGLYEEACDRTNRETWEPVEEDVLMEVFCEIGMEELLSCNQLAYIDDWMQIELPGGNPGWYCRSGSEPRPEEFRRFDKLLTANAPVDYEPYYFRVEPATKAPAVKYGSWKSEDNRLSFEEAVEWMKKGGNVGVAGTPDDELVNVDIDDDGETTPNDLPDTLRARSRSRTGFHAWFFADGEIPNIPTDDAGEIRTDWQYVVAPGSFVASAASEIPDAAKHAGYYSIEEESPIARIQYSDLPTVFQEFHENMNAEPNDDSDVKTETYEQSEKRKSAVYDVEMKDVLRAVNGSSTRKSDRWTAIWHDSSTSANMSYSDGRVHCWRHHVAHGPLQALTVLSGEFGNCDSACRRIGKGHKNSGAGRNQLKGNWKLSWYAWLGAKRRGLIAEEDPVPYTVIKGLADDYDLMQYPDDHDRDTLPAATYNAVLNLIKDEYGINPGREPVGGKVDERRGEANAARETADDSDDEIVASLADDMLE